MGLSLVNLGSLISPFDSEDDLLPIAPEGSLRTTIQNGLVRFLRAFPSFWPVQYTNGISSLAAPAVNPATILVNETDESFGVDTDYGRELRFKTTSWKFSLKLVFNQEVDLSFFQEYLKNNLLYFPKDDIVIEKPITLYLQRMVVRHPPQQGPANGTDALFYFDAKIGRN